MSDPATLQFDTAEPVSGAATDVRCAGCGETLGTYYEVNGAVACRRCRDAALAAASRSHVPTILGALGLGLVAAIAGSALYYAVAKITGYEIGLISIAVGLLVGFAVRKGSRARGGWRYQALAVFLTYLSIASTYVPRAFEGMSAATQDGASAGSAPATPAGAPAAAPSVPAPQAAPAHADAPETSAPEHGAPWVIGVLLLFTLALPFLAGFDNLMGLLIIAIGLWEAWKVNRAAPFSVTGPFAVSAPPPSDG